VKVEFKTGYFLKDFFKKSATRATIQPTMEIRQDKTRKIDDSCWSMV